MKALRKISINQLQIRAHHGLFDFEKINGNDFLIDIQVEYFYQPQSEDWPIDQTIDYGILESIAIQVFQEPTDLLETLCDRILLNILNQFSFLQKIEVHIQKLNPPLQSSIKSTGVSAIFNA